MADGSSEEPIDSLGVAVTPGVPHWLSVVLEVGAPSARMAAAVIAVRYLDADGAVIPGPHPGLSVSELFGPYLYAGPPGREGRIPIEAELVPPEGAARAELALHRWRAGRVEAQEPLWLEPEEGGGAAEGPADDGRLAGAAAPVAAGEVYDVRVRLRASQPLIKRFALAAVSFEDAAGAPVAPGAEVPVSDVAGPYHYLRRPLAAEIREDWDGETAIASFVAPPGAARMRVRILRWDAPADMTALDCAILCRTPPERLAASGEAALRLGDWFVLEGRLQAEEIRDEWVALADLAFLDAAGQPVIAPAEGLDGPRQLPNQAFVTHHGPVAGGAAEVALHLAFRPPPEARLVRWRLLTWAAGRVAPTGPVRVRPLGRDPGSALSALPASARTAPGLDEDHVGLLRRALPGDAPAWTAQGRSTVLLGEAVTETAPGEWLIAGGRIDGPGPEILALHPVFFDARGRPLPAAATPGCAGIEELAPARDVTLGPDGAFSEPVRAPEAAAYAGLYLFALAPVSPARCAAIDCVRAGPDAVLRDFDATLRSPRQLRQAAEIADAVWSLPARRDAYLALGLSAEGTAEDLHRAAAHAEQMAELETGWLPELPPAPPLERDPDAVLHLMKVICPDENSGGAVRSASIVEAQARAGLRPVVCLPLAAPDAGAEAAPDGIAEIARNGARIAYLRFAGIDPGRVPHADLLGFETRMHDRVLRAHRCGLVHAASGFRGYETALKGLALARAHGLPFVYEVRSFHEHTWRPVDAAAYGDAVTRLRTAQEDRCMAEADAVVTISEAMVETLAGRGVPRDRLFLVPNAISEAFETPCRRGDVARLRRREGLGRVPVLGYISNFSGREGHRVLLDAFSALVEGGADLELALVGDGPERDRIAETVRRRGLAGRVRMPGNVDHAAVKAWYGAIDLFVVPRIADAASDHVTPLKPFEAMSQGVPVLMSDRPVAREIAGPAEERAGLFRTGDAADLAARIAAALADRPALAARAAAARDWVLAERTWTRVVTRYGPVYDRAREVHAAAARRAG